MRDALLLRGSSETLDDVTTNQHRACVFRSCRNKVPFYDELKRFFLGVFPCKSILKCYNVMFSIDINVFYRSIFRSFDEAAECWSNCAKAENMYSSAISGSLLGTKINITDLWKPKPILFFNSALHIIVIQVKMCVSRKYKAVFR